MFVLAASTISGCLNEIPFVEQRCRVPSPLDQRGWDGAFFLLTLLVCLGDFLEFCTRDSSDGSELTVPPVTPVACWLFPLRSELIFCLRCQRTDNTLLSTSCRDQRICFCVFITIVRRRFAFLFVGAGADAGLLTSWLTGFNFWRRLCTLPGLLALNSMHRPQQTRNSFWDCFRAR